MEKSPCKHFLAMKVEFTETKVIQIFLLYLYNVYQRTSSNTSRKIEIPCDRQGKGLDTIQKLQTNLRKYDLECASNGSVQEKV